MFGITQVSALVNLANESSPLVNLDRISFPSASELDSRSIPSAPCDKLKKKKEKEYASLSPYPLRYLLSLVFLLVRRENSFESLWIIIEDGV